MNIFKVLSSYDGTISEPNISAMLAYLLNPMEDHGVGYSFINQIVSLLIKGNDAVDSKISSYIKNYAKYQVDVIPEFPVDVTHLNSNRSRRDIDILLEFYKTDDDDRIPEFSICIENKIADSSFSDLNQVRDEVLGLKKSYEDSQNSHTEIHFLLICPSEQDKIKKSFEKITEFNKSYILWKNENHSIVYLLNNILCAESKGSIDPLSTELKYILKSFISFINNDFQSACILEGSNSERRNYGKSIMEYMVELYNGLEMNREYVVSDIKNKLSEMVKKQSGSTLRSSTRNCHFYKVTVNDMNRTNYNVKEPLAVS